MQMKLALVVVLISAAACNDEPKRQLAPTAPTISKSVTAAPAPTGGSTVCLAYARDRSLATAELKEKPSNERLQKRLASLDKLIHGACE
jgi:hypothetical protein